MDEIYLAQPGAEHKARALEYRQAYIDNGETYINGSLGLMACESYERWLEEVEAAHTKETSPIGVPAITYFLIRKADGKIIGTTQLRYELNEGFLKRGGHIGYSIRPEERRRGYGAAQLALVLERARALGIPRVMISCSRDNLASASVALKNDAKLTWEGYDEEDGDIKIFWIEL